MNIFDRLSNAYNAFNKTEPLENPHAWQRSVARVEGMGLPSLSTARAQEDLYRRLSWVQIAVSTVAEQSATTPFGVETKTQETLEEVVAHPFEILLDRPNPLSSRSEYITDMLSFFKLTGNGYTWMNKLSPEAEPSELWVIPSHRIEPIPDENMYIKGYNYDPGDGEPIFLFPQSIMHMKRFNPLNPYVGLSQISQIATVSIGDLAMQQHNTEYFNASNAGKLPGMLAFADSIAQPEWEAMNEDMAENSRKRNLMMMRNVGKGGVEWVEMGISQDDLQFLQGRSFNRSEIFTHLAPGLASWLSENSTEANSKTGRAAFQELAVFPLLTAFAEKITNDILPLYGDNLVGTFEDVRQVDKVVSLAEQLEYAKTHTVEEIREKWWSDGPLGDDRDKKFPAEITSVSSFGTPEPVEEMENIESQTDEAKANEARQFNEFARKRTKEGKADKVKSFKFKHHTEEEAAELLDLWGSEETSELEEIKTGLMAVVDELRK